LKSAAAAYIRSQVDSITSAILSENMNSRSTLFSGEVDVIEYVVVNELFTNDKISLSIKTQLAQNPFGKMQFVLESGERVLVDRESITKLYENGSDFPKTRAQLFSQIERIF
jgi:hypothetical protein